MSKWRFNDVKMTDEDLFRNLSSNGKITEKCGEHFSRGQGLWPCRDPAARRWPPEAKIKICKAKKYCEAKKIRKNAVSIFLEVKVRDLVAVQRRDAGRRRQNNKNKKNMRAARPHTPRLSLHSLHPAGTPGVFLFFEYPIYNKDHPSPFQNQSSFYHHFFSVFIWKISFSL